MIVDTNTVDKTIVFPDTSVRIIIFWENVDGRSTERITVHGISDGLPQPITAAWTRRDGKIETSFSAPKHEPAVFVAKLISIARGIKVPEESGALYEKALDDLEKKSSSAVYLRAGEPLHSVHTKKMFTPRTILGAEGYGGERLSPAKGRRFSPGAS